MTDITPESCRKHAALLGRVPGNGPAIEFLIMEADRLDAAQARDTEAEQLARIYFAAAHPDMKHVQLHGHVVPGFRAVLDHLASRLAPDNGITLTADEAADLLVVTAPRAEYAVAASRRWSAAMDRLRARFAPTEQAESLSPGDSVADQLLAEHRARLAAGRARFAPTEQAESQSPTGFDVRCTKRPDPRTARSWPSLDQVPHDVTLDNPRADIGGSERFVKWRNSHRDHLGWWVWDRRRNEDGDSAWARRFDGLGPFTEAEWVPA